MTQDQEFEGRSPTPQDGSSADGRTTSATKALSRSAIAGLQDVQTSDDEIALLLGGLTSTETKTDAIAEAATTGGEVRPLPSQTQKVAPDEVATRGNASSALEQAPPRPANQPDLTGIFRKVAVKGAVQSPQTADARDRATGKGQNTEAGLGFTQMFQSLAVPRASTNDAQKTAGAAGASSTDYEAAQRLTNGISPSAQGDFTRLFQRVDANGTDVTRIEESFPFRATSAPLAEPVQGGFTQLLRTLSAEQNMDLPVGAPANVRTQEMASSPSGPGEFTRIISGSMLREARARGDRQEEPRIQAPPIQEPQAGESATGTTAPPGQALVLHLAAPSASSAVPSQQGMPAAAAHGLPSKMPSLPHLPKVKLPEALPHSAGQAAPAAAPPTNKLQQYIPLMLIANLFVMVLVLILVAFFLLHH